MMEMSKVCGLAGMLFVLKLPRATVDDIMVLYTSDLGFGWLLTRVVAFILVALPIILR